MNLRHLVIAALACTSAGAMAAATDTSATSTSPSNQGYSSPTESLANKSVQVKPSAAADSSQVSQLQQALNEKGLDAGPVDGKMGPKTKSALKQFQQQQGLTASGRADAQTLAALSIDGSSSASSSSTQSGGGTNGATTSSMPSDTNPPSTTNGTSGMSGTNGSTTSSPQGNNPQGTANPGNGSNGNAQQSGTGRGAGQG